MNLSDPHPLWQFQWHKDITLCRRDRADVILGTCWLWYQGGGKEKWEGGGEGGGKENGGGEGDGDSDRKVNLSLTLSELEWSLPHVQIPRTLGHYSLSYRHGWYELGYTNNHWVSNSRSAELRSWPIVQQNIHILVGFTRIAVNFKFHSWFANFKLT